MLILKNNDNTLSYIINDKANLINTYLEENFQPYSDITDNEYSLTIENIIN